MNTEPNDPLREACESFRQLLVDESTGDLDVNLEPVVIRELTDHTAECPGCAKARAQLRKALIHARSLLVPEPAEEYWDGFVPRLKDRIRTSQQGISLHDVQRKLKEKAAAKAKDTQTPGVVEISSRWKPSWWIPIAGLAAALVLVLLSTVLLSAPGPDLAPRALAPPSQTTGRPSLPLLPGSTSGDLRLAAEDEDLLALLVTEEMSEDLEAFVDDLSTDDVELLNDWLSREDEG